MPKNKKSLEENQRGNILNEWLTIIELIFNLPWMKMSAVKNVPFLICMRFLLHAIFLLLLQLYNLLSLVSLISPYSTFKFLLNGLLLLKMYVGSYETSS